ncbi:hypothetical protein [Shewanella fodinae]|uniref:Uncharacterized protein n=2 Tax=Bacteria TaxID=2 RepID=A0A4R2FHC7_9GAMM|nr:hypothetical protein [Shewanella fodinae]TCN87089.1 hypothetical protein EDC91_10591 [Shewanella fodinae]
MDFISMLFNEYRALVVLLLSMMALIVTITIWWDQVSFWWLNTWYAFPLIGKENRLAKDYETQVKIYDKEWLNSEVALCADFAAHYEKVNKDEELFSKSQDYLGKVTENGRNNLHILGWILIAALVFVEAMGFSYVLSGFTIPGASEKLQQQGAVGIAFIISVLLVGLTHFTGHELHANSLIKKAKVWWKNAKNRDKSTPELAPNTRINLDKTFEDDDEPQYKQLINRISTNAEVKPRYLITTITAVAVVVIAVLATYVRGQVLEKMHIDEVNLKQSSGLYQEQDPYAEAAPAMLVHEAKNADDKASNDLWEREQKGGWGTFIFLAFLFVLLQIFGILIGFKTGFAGKHSKDARKEIGNFKSEREFKTHYSRLKQQVARVAQKRLTNLQQRMNQKAEVNCQDPKVLEMLEGCGNRSFLTYMEDLGNAENRYNQSVRLREHQTTTNHQPMRSVAVATSNTVTDIETPEAMEARLKAEMIADATAKKAADAETPEQAEQRIRQELLAEIAQQKKVVETEDQMRKRLRKELFGELS